MRRRLGGNLYGRLERSMKRKFFPITVLLCLVTALSLFACNKKGEITSLTAKNGTVCVALGSTFNPENLFDIVGDGKPEYSVENTDVLCMENGKIKAFAVGTGYVAASSGNLYARVTVSVADMYRVKFIPEDTTVVYDGEAHLPTVNGKDFPDGSDVIFLQNGHIFSGATDAGEYDLTARLILPSPYYVEKNDVPVKLTVRKKTIDMRDVSFPNATYTYDGTEKSIEITGDLPSGVSVSYTNNKGTDAGVYRAVANFEPPDKKNYNEILSMEATLDIRKRFINISSCGFDDCTVTYDGKEHLLPSVDTSLLPTEVTFRYFLVDKKTKTPVEKGLSFIDSGVYTVSAEATIGEKTYKNYAFVVGGEDIVFKKDNNAYVSVSGVEARLNIDKAAFVADYKWQFVGKDGDKVTSVPYGEPFTVGNADEGYRLYMDGSSHGVSGEYPQGAAVKYISGMITNIYGKYNVGNYTVFAFFEMPEGSEKNYYPLEKIPYILNVEQASYDFSGVKFEYPVQKAEFDSEKHYDDFAVTVSDDDFYKDVSVEYRYTLDGANMGKWAAGKVYHAGVYEIFADFTLLLPDKTQYKKPSSKSVRLEITKKEIVSDTTFSSYQTTFDGKKHSVFVMGTPPEGVRVLYSDGKNESDTPLEYENAGTYVITATYFYKDWAVYDYIIRTKNGINEQKATLTIDKAKYDAVDVSRYTQAASYTFSPSLTVGDIVLTDMEEGVRWQTPTAPVVLISRDEKAHTGTFYPLAIYNRDAVNYEDYVFSVKITVGQAVIDLTDANMPTQFSPRTEQMPQITLRGVDKETASLLKVEATGDDYSDLGKHLYTVTLAAREPNHYYIVGQTRYEEVEVYLYNAAHFVYAPGSTVLTSYVGGLADAVIPDGTTGIGKDAFAAQASCPKSLVFPDTLASVSRGALSSLQSLITLSMPSLSYKGAETLSGLFAGQVPDSLTDIEIRNDKSVPENAFSGLRYIEKVMYLAEVETIGANAFRFCSSLAEVRFTSVPASVGETAFYGCRSLTDLTVPFIGKVDSPKTVAYLFGENSGANEYSSYRLSTLIVTEQKVFADRTFAGLSALSHLVLPESVTQFGMRSFADLTLSLDFSKRSMTVLPAYIFADFDGKVILPEKLEKISSYAFDGFSGDVVLPETVTTLEANAFGGCRGVVIFDKNSKTETIGDGAFYGYEGERIELPASLKTIGKNAFYGSKLVSVVIGKDVVVSENAFRECDCLTEVVFAGKSLGDRAFYGCDLLRSVTVTGDMESLGAYAFYDCFALRSVVLDTSDVFDVGEGAFLSRNDGYAVTFTVPDELYSDFSEVLAVCSNMEKAQIIRK